MNPISLINVIDVEATCWRGEAPPNQVSEIIEVGLCVLNPKTLEVGPARSVLVTPVDSEVSAFCTELTTLTDEKLRAEGIEFSAAITWLRTIHHAKARIWASYGDYDRKAFVKNCTTRGVDYPFGPRHINVKTLVSLAFGWEYEYGMAATLERLGLPLLGTHHRGGDDAHNIALVLAEILRSARGRI